MKRILIFGMTENPGGVEAFLMNYYRRIDRNKIQFDFLCNSYNPIAYEDEVKSLGARTYHIISRRENPVRFNKELNRFFKEHSKDYDTIWVNVSSLANIDYLKMAKKYGIKRRIIHSHNSRNMDGKIRGLMHEHNKKHIDKYATDFWACSASAAKWFYEDELLPQVVIIKNAIDLKKTCFSLEKRNNIRETYRIQNSFVIGNVGRLHFQKNQMFAIETFKHVLDDIPNAVLMLVGQGENEEKLRQYTKKLGIEDRVIFTGVQDDIQAYLSAFDLFLFPSIFEGLSIAALEAQANGLPVLASNHVIPDELKLLDNYKRKDLEDGPAQWAKEIDDIYQSGFVRIPQDIINSSFTREGYNIETEVKRLEKLLG